jgi:hypothetical protein
MKKIGLPKECIDHLFDKGFEFDFGFYKREIFSGTTIVATFVDNEPNINTRIDIHQKHKYSSDVVYRAVDIGFASLQYKILKKINSLIDLDKEPVKCDIFSENIYSLDFIGNENFMIKELTAFTSSKILLKPVDCGAERVGFTMELYFDLQDIDYEMVLVS